MKAIKKTITEVTLILDEEEACWLQGIMQNPLNGNPDPAQEEERDAVMRERFWKSLDR